MHLLVAKRFIDKQLEAWETKCLLCILLKLSFPPLLTLMKMFLLHMPGVRLHKPFTSVLQRYVIHKQKQIINAF